MDVDSGRTWQPAATAVGVAVLVVISAVTAPPSRIPLDLISSALLVIPALATAARHRFPLVVLSVATASLLVYQVLGYPGVAPSLTVIVALYATVKAGHRWPAGVAVGVILVAGFAGESLGPGAGRTPPDSLQRWLLLIGWMVAACVAAELSRQRRREFDAAERRAADAERTREETARRRADEERLRIARELHDSLTHSISLITVQAGVAVHLARKRGEQIPEALLTIQETSREAMRELRATLEVLRADENPAGLDRLDGLIEGARKAGLPVTVVVSGQRRELPEPVDRAAYRIVQEALTNVTRHAGPATAAIRLDYGESELAVRIDDDGTGDTTTGPAGVGLLGMHERVTALGGSLHAGPRPGAGFRVQATLPVAAPS